MHVAYLYLYNNRHVLFFFSDLRNIKILLFQSSFLFYCEKELKWKEIKLHFSYEIWGQKQGFVYWLRKKYLKKTLNEKRNLNYLSSPAQ